jgi:hypothetical protein
LVAAGVKPGLACESHALALGKDGHRRTCACCPQPKPSGPFAFVDAARSKVRADDLRRTDEDTAKTLDRDTRDVRIIVNASPLIRG